MNKNIPPDVQFFESRIANLFSNLGLCTNIRKKLHDGETSPLHIGCTYYRRLVTNLADQYNNIKPLIPHLLEIAEKYPERFISIREELQNLKEILFEFEKQGRFREIDLTSFLLGNGTDTSYDDSVCLLLKDRLIQSINRLEVVTRKEFNWLELPGYVVVEVNMLQTERCSYTSEGPVRTLRIPTGGERRKPYFRKTG